MNGFRWKLAAPGAIGVSLAGRPAGAQDACERWSSLPFVYPAVDGPVSVARRIDDGVDVAIYLGEAEAGDDDAPIASGAGGIPSRPARRGSADDALPAGHHRGPGVGWTKAGERDERGADRRSIADWTTSALPP